MEEMTRAAATAAHPAGDDFCDRLVAAQVVPRTQAEVLRQRAAQTRTPLGRILIELRFMEVKQVMDLLYKQSEQPGVRIGEMAVRLGYLTRAQLDRALAEQAERTRHPAELLLEGSEYGVEELWPHLLRYVKQLEQSALSAQSGLLKKGS